MRGAVRLADFCSGHDCWPPRPTNSASTNVFVNERGSHRKNDTFISHCCGPNCHPGVTVQGSTNVFVNNREIARKFDQVNCGSTCLQCSENVLINT